MDFQLVNEYILMFLYLPAVSYPTWTRYDALGPLLPLWLLCQSQLWEITPVICLTVSPQTAETGWKQSCNLAAWVPDWL